RLLYDVQPQAATVTWLLDVEPDDLPITLAWDPARTPNSRWLWLARVDESGAAQGATFVDMVTRRRAEIAAEGLWQVTLGDERTEALRLEPEWNLVALGITPPLQDPDIAFGPACVPGMCWGAAGDGWDATLLLPAFVIEPSAGYWIYCSGADTPLLSGPAAATTLALRSGWNLVGVGWDAVLPDEPAIAGIAWGWDAARQTYTAVAPGGRLDAGRAYWLFVTRRTLLDLPPAPLP
ncbi:MAG: hypothetical protein JXR77_01525, partial [Lentisphaeria bacterium]|nr:hypothetical protein [Lentisphaeria bacterium]